MKFPANTKYQDVQSESAVIESRNNVSW